MRPDQLHLIRALEHLVGTPPPPPARIRNGGRQIEKMIGAPGTRLKMMRNAFLRHWGSWTSINEKMNRNVVKVSIIRMGSPRRFFKSGPFFPHAKSFPIVASLWSLILPKFCSLHMVPFIVLVLGLVESNFNPSLDAEVMWCGFNGFLAKYEKASQLAYCYGL